MSHSNTKKTKNKRRADRHKFRCHVALENDEKTFQGHLLNLSETGALVAILEEPTLSKGDSISLYIQLKDAQLKLAGEVAHSNKHYVGISCQTKTQIDYQRFNLLVSELDAYEPD